jgi:small-conductance mechanosensitive channel
MENFSEILQKMIVNFLEFLPKAILGMVIFIIGLYFAGLISNFVRRTLERRGTDNEVKMVAVQVTRWTIILGGIFLGLRQMGFDLSAFLVSLGVVGFTIGFALQDISKNFVAGLLILLQQPFDIGDAIEVTGYSGTVENVDLRATEIRTFDGKIVLIPNADVYTNPITNFSRGENRRLDLTIGVAYDTDLELARTTALEAISQVEGVLQDPVPQVVFENFGGSTIDFIIYFWINSQENSILTAKDQAVVQINAAYVDKGIEMPYPIQTVLVKQ